MSPGKKVLAERNKLRQKAEVVARKRVQETIADFATVSPAEMQRIVHELRVHQVELEMQNEELRRIHVELDTERARYFALYDLAPIGYLTVNERGSILSANLCAARLLGVERGEMLKRTINSFVVVEDLGIFLGHHKRSFATSEQNAYELRLVKSGGRSFWAHLAAVVGDNNEGERVCRLVLSDINERKLAEQALRQNEGQHRTILQTGMDGFWIIDTDGRFREVNDAYCRLVGYSAEELLQCGISDLDCPGNAAAKSTWIPRVLEKGRERFETCQRRKDGSLVYVEVSVQYNANLGGLWIAFVRDRTQEKLAAAEREKLQDQLNQARKMESIGRLAGGVAHDFNNMLMVITGEAEMALELVGDHEPLRTGLEAIASAAKRSAQLTQQLLAFARKQTVAPRVVNLNDGMEALLAVLRRLLEKRITLTWSPNHALWLVKLDPSQIDQILINLCINSSAAIVDVGEINIVARNRSVGPDDPISVEGMLPGDYVTLSVRDNGCGMDADTQRHIFEPFFTTKEVGAGTGLGLAMAYGVVQQNNGFMEVESAPSMGTTITIHLPRYHGAAPEAPTLTVAGVGGRGHETILLVEDDPSVLQVTTKMLVAQGYRVLSAGSGDEALRFSDEDAKSLDMVITDLVMPGMNGKELANLLHARYPRVKILFVSGYPSNVFGPEGVLGAGVDFEPKPFSTKDLTAKIRKILDT